MPPPRPPGPYPDGKSPASSFRGAAALSGVKSPAGSFRGAPPPKAPPPKAPPANLPAVPDEPVPQLPAGVAAAAKAAPAAAAAAASPPAAESPRAETAQAGGFAMPVRVFRVGGAFKTVRVDQTVRVRELAAIMTEKCSLPEETPATLCWCKEKDLIEMDAVFQSIAQELGKKEKAESNLREIEEKFHNRPDIQAGERQVVEQCNKTLSGHLREVRGLLYRLKPDDQVLDIVTRWASEGTDAAPKKKERRGSFRALFGGSEGGGSGKRVGSEEAQKMKDMMWRRKSTMGKDADDQVSGDDKILIYVDLSPLVVLSDEWHDAVLAGKLVVPDAFVPVTADGGSGTPRPERRPVAPRVFKFYVWDGSSKSMIVGVEDTVGALVCKLCAKMKHVLLVDLHKYALFETRDAALDMLNELAHRVQRLDNRKQEIESILAELPKSRKKLRGEAEKQLGLCQKKILDYLGIMLKLLKRLPNNKNALSVVEEWPAPTPESEGAPERAGDGSKTKFDTAKLQNLQLDDSGNRVFFCSARNACSARSARAGRHGGSDPRGRAAAQGRAARAQGVGTAGRQARGPAHVGPLPDAQEHRGRGRRIGRRRRRRDDGRCCGRVGRLKWACLRARPRSTTKPKHRLRPPTCTRSDGDSHPRDYGGLPAEPPCHSSPASAFLIDSRSVPIIICYSNRLHPPRRLIVSGRQRAHRPRTGTQRGAEAHREPLDARDSRKDALSAVL